MTMDATGRRPTAVEGGAHPLVAVDPASGVPPFEQVRAGIAARVEDGSLPVGTRLPPVRALAADLGLAANTVARAYRELEEGGLVETAGRRGTVVAAGGDAVRRRAASAAAAYADAVHALGVDDETAVALVRAAVDSRHRGTGSAGRPRVEGGAGSH